MKPLSVLCAQMYSQSQLPEGAFADALIRAFFYGFIVDRPNLLVLAEPCYTDGAAILYPGKNQLNCWWVHFVTQLGAGSISDMLETAPYPLEYVAFRRRNKLKIYTWEQLRREDIYGRRTTRFSTAST
jgi:hypothetical protein